MDEGYKFQSDSADDILSMHISVKAAWSIVAAIVAGAVWTSAQLWDLKQSIKDGTGDRWKRSYQREFSNQLRSQNTNINLQVPNPDEIVRQLNEN